MGAAGGEDRRRGQLLLCSTPALLRSPPHLQPTAALPPSSAFSFFLAGEQFTAGALFILPPAPSLL